MSLLTAITSIFRRSEISAAAANNGSSKLVGGANPTQVKVPKQGQSKLTYMTTSNISSGQAISRPDRSLINTDITTYRTGSDTLTIMRDFAVATPDLSASVDAYIRTAVTSNYTAIAKNLDGTFNRDATIGLQSILTKFDILKNYDEGFSNTNSIRAVAESLAKEFRYYGAASLELVLDKSKIPVRLQPVSVTTVKFAVDKEGLKPVQTVDSTEIDLDIPTYFYRSIDQDLLTPYPNSPMESALQPILFMQEFMNDLRRIVRQAIHPRIKVTLDTNAVLAQMPAEWQETDEKRKEYMQAVIQDVANEINGLEPEDALVTLDNITVEYLTAGNISHDTEMTALRNIIDGKVSTGVKTMPSILGQGSASSNIASTESLLFMKSAEGVQFALNDLLSQALTLAIRLMGYDVYVEFSFGRIDLRPETELGSFRAMEQSRVLELNSLGFMGIDETSLRLTGKLAPAEMVDLTGTFFKGIQTPEEGNAYSNTSAGTLNQNLSKTDTPKNAKSQNGGKKGNT